MEFRARESATNEKYFFTLQDYPVTLDSKRVVLMNKPFTPVLSRDTIGLFDKGMGVAVGDIVRINGKIFTVGYDKGFVLLESGVYLSDFRVSEVEVIGYDRDVNSLSMRVYSEDRNVTPTALGELYLSREGLAYLKTYKEPTPIKSIRVGTGISSRSGYEYLFSSQFRSRQIVLYKGQPAIDIKNSVYILDKKGGMTQ